MNHAEVDQLLKLPAAERLALASALWDSLAGERDLPLPDWQVALLDAALVEHAATPDAVFTWDEVRRQLQGRP